jgi:hypothetical protein
VIVPPAGLIESAQDSLKLVDVKALHAQQCELYAATGRSDACFANGYQLGLQVARTVLMANVLLQMKGIDARELL